MAVITFITQEQLLDDRKKSHEYQFSPRNESANKKLWRKKGEKKYESTQEPLSDFSQLSNKKKRTLLQIFTDMLKRFELELKSEVKKCSGVEWLLTEVTQQLKCRLLTCAVFFDLFFKSSWRFSYIFLYIQLKRSD